MTPELKAALREIALSHSQGMYMHNPDGEFVPVNAEALAVQLEGEIQPEIERLVVEARLKAEIKIHDEYWHSQKYVAKHGIGALALANKEATELELRTLTQSNQKEEGR